MSSEKFSVLVVDDSISDLQMTIGFLNQYYQVAAASNGAAALEMISRHRPDLVLLDVNMPEVNGYEVCARIRALDKTLKVIFVSANDSTEEILKGYDVGGNDYIVKPFVPDILLSKIEATIRSASAIELLSKESTHLAMEAMTSMGELGAVLTFLRSSFHVSNTESLAALMMVSMETYGLDVCLQLRTLQDKKNYANQNIITPLEEELLIRIAKMPNRFAENGKRMFINYDNASLLIKNMPIDDEFKVGRLRDNLAILLEGANEKQSFFSVEEDIASAILVVQEKHQEIKCNNLDVLATTLEKIKMEFLHLELTNAQQENVLQLFEECKAKIAEGFDGAREAEQSLEDIIKRMQEVTVPLSSAAGSIDFY